MKDTELYSQILGIEKPWKVVDVQESLADDEVQVTVNVPWAEPGSGFAALFEALVINWLKQASTSAVAERLRLSWNAVDGVMQRAVKRGLSRRGELSPRRLRRLRKWQHTCGITAVTAGLRKAGNG